MSDITSDGTAATVTVTAGTAPDRTWEASAIEVTEEGALLIGAGEKDGVAEIYAIYAPGHWTSAALDDHRAAAGPDREALAAELESLHTAITVAAWHGDLPDAERVGRIRKLLGLPGEQAIAATETLGNRQ